MMIFVPYTEENADVANSYLSVNEADALVAMQDASNGWTNFDAEAKKLVLVQASIHIDAIQNYQHDKTSPKQVLKFPRNKETEIPINIKMAIIIVILDVVEKKAFATQGEIIKRETISKFTTEYFSPKEINFRSETDLSVLSMLKPLRQHTIKYSHGR